MCEHPAIEGESSMDFAATTADGGIILSPAIWAKVQNAMSRREYALEGPMRGPPNPGDTELVEALHMIRSAGVDVEQLT